MTVEQLLKIMPMNWVEKAGMKAADSIRRKREVASMYILYLNEFMSAYDINNPRRVAAFIAQVAHESGELKYTREIWGPTAAQKGYEGRKDLGNIYPGDGKRFMGRGLIQVTGRANYESCSVALTGTPVTFLAAPDLLSTPMYAVRSACWFWSVRGLNTLADTADIKTVTRRVNGGYKGLEDRIKYWERAKALCA